MKLCEEQIEQLKATEVMRLLKEERVFRIDSTGFGAWDACTMKGIMANALRRKPARKADALLFGGCVHAGLEEHYVNDAPVGDQIKSALGYAKAEGYEPPEKDGRSLPRVAECLMAYNEEWFDDDIIPLEAGGKKLVENTFCVKLGMVGDVEVQWTGMLDVIGFYNRFNWVVDHKTTTVMGPQYDANHLRSNQVLGYVFVANEFCKLMGLPRVTGALLNVIALRKRGFDFQRFQIPVAGWALEEWQTEIVANVRDILGLLQTACETGVVLPTRESCCTKYGKCDYFEVCQSSPQTRARLLGSGEFINDTWNVLDKGKGKLDVGTV